MLSKKTSKQMKISFIVFGKQVTQGSKTVLPVGKGRFRAVDRNRRELNQWRGAIAQAAGAVMSSAEMFAGAVRLRIVFTLPRPKGHFGKGRNSMQLRPSAPQYPAKKPDLLKLARAVEDALSGVVYRDDSQVCKLEVEKRYGQRYETRVEVEEL